MLLVRLLVHLFSRLFGYLFGHRKKNKVLQILQNTLFYYFTSLCYFTSLPGFTSRPGMMTARLPSLFSALRIMPSLTMPFSLRGARLAIRWYVFPVRRQS